MSGADVQEQGAAPGQGTRLTSRTQGGHPVQILYLVPDTMDAAAERRVRMLEAGGAVVRLAGFRRADLRREVQADFGLTRPAKLAERALSVAKVCLSLRRFRSAAEGADVIVCRNLECLLIGERLRSRYAPSARLVYEVLDIHRVMVGEGRPSQALRQLEHWLMGRCDLLLTSSPAFLDAYFARFNPVSMPVRLVENRVFPPPASPAIADRLRAQGRSTARRPFVIGWFGVIRCRRSLALLCDLARELDGAVEIVIRGRPAEHEFDDFAGTVAASPHVTFLGPYRNPDDLADIYGAVDFVWAIDFFEDGLNSSWLLPNRLYEGCYFGAVPLADKAVETGRWLAARHLGVLFSPVSASTLAACFRDMTETRLDGLREAIRALPAETWLASDAQCRALVADLAGANVPVTEGRE